MAKRKLTKSEAGRRGGQALATKISRDQRIEFSRKGGVNLAKRLRAEQAELAAYRAKAAKAAKNGESVAA